MIRAVLTGLFVAIIVSLPGLLHEKTDFLPWFSPWMIALPATLAILFQKYFVSHRGLPSLLAHLILPRADDMPRPWAVRALTSLAFAVTGYGVGTEGAGAEAAQSAALSRRTSSSRWSENLRRTDGATALAAAISASMGAPFAAFVLTLELGMGGRSVYVAAASVASYALSRGISQSVGGQASFDVLGALYGFNSTNLGIAISVASLGLLTGALAFALLRTLKAAGRLQAGSKRVSLVLVLIAAALIASWMPSGHLRPSEILEQALWSKRGAAPTLALGLSFAFASILLCVRIGAIGIFWPILAIGGVLCSSLALWIQSALGAALLPNGWVAAFGLLGTAGFFGAFFGAPLTGALLVLELGTMPALLIPALITSLIAHRFRRALGAARYSDAGLAQMGLSLENGRLKSVIRSLRVSDAMTTVFESVGERETVADLHRRILSARHPFLVVLNPSGRYLGLLTIDAIDDAWRVEDPGTSHAPLARLLEAKDLLYRSGRSSQRVAPLAVDASLADIVLRLEQEPCLPVVDSDGRVQGLVFAHNVRLAYDQELARRNLTPLS